MAEDENKEIQGAEATSITRELIKLNDTLAYLAKAIVGDGASIRASLKNIDDSL